MEATDTSIDCRHSHLKKDQHMPNPSRISDIDLDAAPLCVVITAHDMEDCLEASLESLSAQTLKNFRAIIIEDGSSDATGQIADQFAARDPRFEAHHTSNLRAAGARNYGIALVREPAFMVLDGDDIFHPTLLERLHNALQQNNADIALCNIDQFDHATGSHEETPWALKISQLPTDHDVCSWQDLPGNIFAAFMGWPWDKIYRTAFVRDHGLAFPEDLPNSEDMLFTYQALVLARRIAVVRDVLISHRVGRGGSVSNSRAKAPLAFYDALCRMKEFLQNQTDDAWSHLQRHYLNWAFDWTLWNIENMENDQIRTELASLLAKNEFLALELAEHEPVYFTEYPRSMARYASILNDVLPNQANDGPLGPLNALPYGKFKPWCQANAFEKLTIRHRMRRRKPSEW